MSEQTEQAIKALGISEFLRLVSENSAATLPQKLDAVSTNISTLWAPNPPSLRFVVGTVAESVDIKSLQIRNKNYLCSTETLSMAIRYGAEVGYTYLRPDGTMLGVTKVASTDCGFPPIVDMEDESATSSVENSASELETRNNLGAPTPTDMPWNSIFLGTLGGCLVGLAMYRRKSNVDMGAQLVNDRDVENQKIRLLDRWSIRGILLGFGAGIFQTLGMGYTGIGFMVGSRIPLALVFGLIGLVLDIFRNRKISDSERMN
ncbi:hypothetical protein N9X99_00590 [Gammaproteobacteria bacterium]|nr:hypothetical protein [Gammaproteobacteria bacterium]